MPGKESDQKKSKGILTLREGVMMPNGYVYRFIWHDDWINVGGSNVVRMKVRDSKGYVSEELYMASFDQGVSVGFASCDEPPSYNINDIYVFGGSK